MRSLSKGEVPILEEGLPALVAEGLGARRLRFVVGAANAARDGRVRVPVRADAAVRRRVPPTSPRSRRWPARSRRCSRPGTVVVNKSTMPVGSTAVRRPRASSQAGAADRRRASPRTPSSSARAPRSATSSNPDRIVIGCDDPAVAVRVSELYRDVQAPDPRHRPRVGRDDQVRVERVPRHQDLVHQRHRQPVRGGRRRRARGRARHGLRPAHRVRVPPPRARATAARASRRTPPRCSTPPSTRATTSACCAAWSR